MVEATLSWIFGEAAFQLSGGWINLLLLLLFLAVAFFLAQNKQGLPAVLMFMVIMSYTLSFFGGIFLSIFYAVLLGVGGLIGLGILYFAKQ